VQAFSSAGEQHDADQVVQVFQIGGRSQPPSGAEAPRLPREPGGHVAVTEVCAGDRFTGPCGALDELMHRPTLEIVRISVPPAVQAVDDVFHSTDMQGLGVFPIMNEQPAIFTSSSLVQIALFAVAAL
jgi:hypothetical protein